MHEFELTGERQLLTKLSQFDFKAFFDVGANEGEWTGLVQELFDATVHAFEPVPSTYRKYIANMMGEGVVPNSFGLSDKNEWIDIKSDLDNDKLTSIYQEMRRENFKIIPTLMVDGASYCRSREIESIDFLKIDTEGHEFKVVTGFHEFLQQGKIQIIQFEYGYANVLSRDLLIDFYKLLTPLGYSIGKLCQEGVEFKDYNLLDEDFRGPNYIAVHSSAPDIMELIQT